METPGHIVVLAQDPRRHISRAGAHGRELKTPAGIFLQGDATGGRRFDRARYLIDRGSEVPVCHPDDRLPCLLDAGHDLLVLDLLFGISLCLLAYLLPISVVLT
jgi:hypothetical protein